MRLSGSGCALVVVGWSGVLGVVVPWSGSWLVLGWSRGGCTLVGVGLRVGTLFECRGSRGLLAMAQVVILPWLGSWLVDLLKWCEGCWRRVLLRLYYFAVWLGYSDVSQLGKILLIFGWFWLCSCGLPEVWPGWGCSGGGSVDICAGHLDTWKTGSGALPGAFLA